MSAHPMLQPVDWNLSPQTLAGSVHPDRLSIYEVIWNCAIATTLKPPVLTHRRTFIDHASSPLVIASVAPTSRLAGYWQFRQDYPQTVFPINHDAALGPWVVKDAQPVPSDRVSLGRLIYEMTRISIATPASLAGFLKNTLEPTSKKTQRLKLAKDAPIFTGINGRQFGAKWSVTLTGRAVADLQKWQAAGINTDATSLREAIADISSGEMTVRDALDSVLPKDFPINLEKAIQAIELACDKWRGLGREDGLRQLAGAGVRPPHVSGLPAWLDPELILEPDHPLRSIRQVMEHELGSAIQGWRLLAFDKQVRHRQAWLRHKKESGQGAGALIPDLGQPNARFDALLIWLQGGNSH